MCILHTLIDGGPEIFVPGGLNIYMRMHKVCLLPSSAQFHVDLLVIVYLPAYITDWRAEGRNAVWLHIPISLSALIPLAAGLGFTLHHARGKEVVMNRWLREDKPNKLPHYASHQVGVCGKICDNEMSCADPW